MNRMYYWIVALLLLCVGCRKGELSYVITGKVIHPNANGNIIYLSHSNGDELVNLDSVIVDGGQFTLTGVQELPIVAYLRFKYPSDSLAAPALFVLENGTLSAHMDIGYSRVTGTTQNNEFESFLREVHRLDSLRESQFQSYLAQVEAGTMDAAAEQEMYENDRRWEREHIQLAYEFIDRDNSSPASLWLLETMQSQFTEDELSELISNFRRITKVGKRPPIVEKITQRLRNADKVDEGSAYLDIDLIDNRGRSKKLSNYTGYARYTVVGFWRSDSEPARRDIATFARLQQELGYSGVAVLGVSLDENQEVWKKQIADLNLPVASQCRVAQVDEAIAQYALVSVPTFLVIAPDGTIDSRNLSLDEVKVRLQNILPQSIINISDTLGHESFSR